MTFKAAKCPNCAGDIQVPDDRDTVKCMYCGSDIIVREAIKAAAGGVNVDNLMLLAKNAQEAKKWVEAYKYYSIVLEHNPKNIDAWIGKGLSAIDDRHDPFIDVKSLHTALNYSPNKEETKRNIIQGIEKRIVEDPRHDGYKNIYEVCLGEQNWTFLGRQLLKINEFDPNNDLGLIAMGFENLWEGPASEYFQKALSSTTNKTILIDIIVKHLDRYYRSYVCDRGFELRPSLQHAIEFANRIKPGAIVKLEPQKQSNCFIATAAYGTPMASEVILLRQFRDTYLESRPFGKAFIKAYYMVSPQLAGIISKSKILRAITRQSLKPIVSLVKEIMGKDLSR